MLGAFLVRGDIMPETRSGGGRGKKRRPHSMALPRTVTLKAFQVSMLTILEDSDRVDSAETTDKFASSYSVLDSGQDASVTHAYMRELHTRR